MNAFKTIIKETTFQENDFYYTNIFQNNLEKEKMNKS